MEHKDRGGGKEKNFGPHPLFLVKTWHSPSVREGFLYTPDTPKQNSEGNKFGGGGEGGSMGLGGQFQIFLSSFLFLI